MRAALAASSTAAPLRAVADLDIAASFGEWFRRPPPGTSDVPSSPPAPAQIGSSRIKFLDIRNPGEDYTERAGREPPHRAPASARLDESSLAWKANFLTGEDNHGGSRT